jgi:hypothetical protein
MRENSRIWLAALLMFPLIAPQALAAFPPISFSAESVEYGDLKFGTVSAETSGDVFLELRVETLSMEGQGQLAQDMRLFCKNRPETGRAWCEGGQWEITPALDMPVVSGVINAVVLQDRGLNLGSSLEAGNIKADLSAHYDVEGFQSTLSWTGQSLAEFEVLSLLRTKFQWLYAGESSGQLAVRLKEETEPDVRFQLEIQGLGFDSPDGRFAGDSLNILGHGSLSTRPKFTAQLSGSIQSGELLIDDFYRNFSDASLNFKALPVLEDTEINVGGIRIDDGDSLKMEGNIRVETGDSAAPPSFQVSLLELSFPRAYERYMESTASIWTLDGLATAGRLTWSGEWQGAKDDRTFRSGVLNLSDLTVVDNKRGRFAITGVDAHLRPGDHAFTSRLSWQGSLLQRINLGAGAVELESAPGSMRLAAPLVLEVLGGRVTFDELGVSLPDGGQADVHLEASIDGLEMEQLTAALDWPAFSGEISGKIPGVSLKDGVLSVDGEIDMIAFGGQLLLTGLSIERPFGVLPSLAADIEASNLNLELLTSTFSFGQISGRLDGHVRDLRMLDWKPVAFDAWLGTPERQEGSNDISRQAVNRLTTIGGGSATTLLTGPVLRLFNNFSYRRLGLGCRLQNNVCDVRGLDDDDVSVLILEGSGIPKIMIRAFNRRMDWPQLVAALSSFSGED